MQDNPYNANAIVGVVVFKSVTPNVPLFTLRVLVNESSTPEFPIYSITYAITEAMVAQLSVIIPPNGLREVSVAAKDSKPPFSVMLDVNMSVSEPPTKEGIVGFSGLNLSPHPIVLLYWKEQGCPSKLDMTGDELTSFRNSIMKEIEKSKPDDKPEDSVDNNEDDDRNPNQKRLILP